MLTRSITTAMTRNVVLQTQELLEHILQHLPIEDLVTYRRVNKHFKNTIDFCPKLQTKMFLRVKCERLWVFDNATKLLQPYTPGDSERLGDKWVQRQSLMRPTVLNPLLFTTEEEARRPPLLHRARVCEGLRFIERPNLSRTKDDCIFHRMFVCQPPVPAIEFLIHFNPNKTSRRLSAEGKQYRDSALRAKLKNRQGVTFGDLIEAFRSQIRDHYPKSTLPHSSNFRVHVSDKKQSQMSRVWLLGAIYVSDEEKAAVENKVEMRKPLSPLAAKMRTPEFLRDGAREAKAGEGHWGEDDYEFAGGFDVSIIETETEEDIEPDFENTPKVVDT